jgi:hypothetical protein
MLAREISKDRSVLRRVWEILNSLSPKSVYGGGLYKLEPKELGNVDAIAIVDVAPELQNQLAATQTGLFDRATA